VVGVLSPCEKGWREIGLEHGLWFCEWKKKGNEGLYVVITKIFYFS